MIERVGRLEDPRLAGYARVGDSRWLREHGLFVGEGRLVVRRLVEDGRFDVTSILLTPAALAALSDLLVGATAPCPVYVCEQAELDALAGFNFHRGCLALARRPGAAAAESFHDARLLVALEEVGNPDNVGGIFRSAHAFGAGGVILDMRCADPLYRKSVRTSMAAALRVPFAQPEDWIGALEGLRAAGFQVVAFTPSAGAVDLGDVPRPSSGKIVLLFGNEGTGLSTAALGVADLRGRIPIDPRSDSLNVAVAAGIALHHFRRI